MTLATKKKGPQINDLTGKKYRKEYQGESRSRGRVAAKGEINHVPNI